MYEPWFSFPPDRPDHVLHRIVGSFKITPIYLYTIETLETCCKFKGVHGPSFGGCYANAPIIILDKVDQWQLFQHRKLKSFTYLSFRDTCISQRTDHYRQLVTPTFLKISRIIFFQ